MSKISFDYSASGIGSIFTETQLKDALDEALKAKTSLDSRTGKGNNFLGWLDLPEKVEPLLDEMLNLAAEIRENCDIFIVIGIGGSYLGTKAAITAMQGPLANATVFTGAVNGPAILYAGCDISSRYVADLMKLIKGKRVYINVVSKSGTTTEPAIAFRLLFDALAKEIGESEAHKRCIATTDKARGALKSMADKEGWRTFVIPDDVGGRYSVMTPVGLLPMAVAGVDIKNLIEGAKAGMALCQREKPEENIACVYAAVRNLLYRAGKEIEIFATFDPQLKTIGEWWKQLYGESEGKENKGIYPDSLEFSTDLHSMGQYIQQGKRILMESFIVVEKNDTSVVIPKKSEDGDGLNYLAGRELHTVNMTALDAVARAHYSGGVPVMKFVMPELNPYFLGQLFYIFEYACGVSGYILGVNPFDQPGVESYKKNMFALLGKPGFEELRAELTGGKCSSKSYIV